MASLPNELVLAIIASVHDVPTLAAVARTCRSLYKMTLPFLHGKALDRDDAEVDNPNIVTDADPYALPLVLWAAASRDLPLLETILALRPAHLTARLRLPATTCRGHWPWYRHVDVTVGHTTALHVAATVGDLPTLQWLLRHHRPSARGGGPGIDEPSRFACVCPSRHLSILQLFHVIYDPEDAPHASPLHLALCHGRVDCARLLVERGADWSRPLRGSHGVTGLMIMVANGLLPLFEWLLAQGLVTAAAANERDDLGLAALNYASACRDGAVAESMAKSLMLIVSGGGCADLHGAEYAYNSSNNNNNAQGTDARAPSPSAAGHDVERDRDHEQIQEYSRHLEACPVYTARCVGNDHVLKALCRRNTPDYHKECLLTADWQIKNGQR
ncbi:ankyrin unc44 [Colletotrichum tofieldiae]|uniref:Ankyrin unc44 n=1 Tax=Colletotrichum tofieldiae TaxID=708197 RepID=A0A166NLZ5_9PEZI|nr:ankyrin unc44 [Colletotrichum tofieldiae]